MFAVTRPHERAMLLKTLCIKNKTKRIPLFANIMNIVYNRNMTGVMYIAPRYDRKERGCERFQNVRMRRRGSNFRTL